MWLRFTVSYSYKVCILFIFPYMDHRLQTASCQSSEAWLWAAAPTHRADAMPLNQFISHQLLINNPSISSLRSCPEWVYNKLRIVAESFIDTRRNQIFIIKQLLVWKCDQSFLPSGVQITAVKSGIVPTYVQDIKHKNTLIWVFKSNMKLMQTWRQNMWKGRK